MITASIVTYKTNEYELKNVLQCTINASVDKIYIIDNSPDDKLSCFKYLSAKIEYLWGHGNIGYGRAHNIAIRSAIKYNSKYHVVINPDISFKSDLILHLKNYMDSESNIGLMMPRIIYPNGKLQYLCKLLPSPMDLFGRRFLFYLNFVNRRNDKYELRFTNYNRIMNVPFLSGCFMFLRVESLLKVGLFDEHIFMYAEDLDLSRRIHEYYKTVFYPKLTIVHSHKKESYKNFRMLIIHIKSIIYYFNKWGWYDDKKRVSMNKKILSELNFKG